MTLPIELMKTEIGTRKRALVLGASSGIGKAVVERLLSEDWQVTAASRNIRAELFRNHPSLTTFNVDLAEPNGIIELSNELSVSLSPRFDSLVYCAGEYISGELSDAEILRIFQVNTYSFYRLMTIGTQLLTVGAQVVAVSSISSNIGSMNSHIYSASKAALNALVRSFAMSLAEHRVRVVGIAPGMVATPMSHAALSDIMTKRKIEAQTPLGRIAQPEDISNAIIALLNYDTRWINGQIITADGGRSVGSYEALSSSF